MEGQFVSLRKDRHIGIITIDNPPVNVINAEVRKEIKACVLEAGEDDSLVAVIITGMGEKAFMAGADIKEFPDMIKKEKAAYDFVQIGYETWDLIEGLKKPTIAAINGLALGAGCEMSLCCDIRVASEKAKIGLPEIKLGLFPGGGGTQRLPRLIGASKAKAMMYTGDPISADEAKEIGLVDYVAKDALAKSMEIAEKINKFSLLALGAIKTAVNEGLDKTLHDGIEREANLFQDIFMGDDITEGVTAFFEKREAKFR
jgi:enoyl-CoA hydratase/carnithine racemase